MANICDNKFYFSCENHIENWEKKFSQFFDELGGDWESNGCNWIEGYFESRWTFPREDFEELFKDAPKEDDVYFRCLSEEYGLGYVAMNIFENGMFRPEQCFNL